MCEEYDIDAIFFLMGRRFMLSRANGTQTELRFKQTEFGHRMHTSKSR
ncbi:hypothetical protein [Pasteurella multocida]